MRLRPTEIEVLCVTDACFILDFRDVSAIPYQTCFGISTNPDQDSGATQDGSLLLGAYGRGILRDVAS